ncbi:MAG: hypothetical protein WBV82_05885 [Myxococcaceae bacterium]
MGILDSLFRRRPVEEWVTVAPPEGAFTIDMPSPPKIEVTDKPVPRMGLLHQLTSLPISQSALYRVQFSELDDSASGKDAETLLNELVGRGAPTLESRRISIDGNPGVESLDKEKRVCRRTYLAGRSFYVLLVVEMNPKHIPADTQRFFDSFRLIERRPRIRFGNLSFEIPPGWDVTKADATTMVVSSPRAYSVGPISKPDNFTVSLSPANGGTARDHLASAMQLGKPDQLEALNKLVENDAGAITGLASGRVRGFHLGAMDGFALYGPSTLTVNGVEFTYDGPRAFVVYQDRLYTIAARYSIERESDVGPIAVAFISSIRIEE